MRDLIKIRFFLAMLLPGIFCFRVQSKPLGTPKSPKLLIVAIDGMDSRWVNERITPFLSQLKQKGSSTLSMRNVTPTITAPNFTSSLTGTLPIYHQIFDNDWTAESGIIPPNSIFDLFSSQPGQVLIVSDDWEFYQDAFASPPKAPYPSIVIKRNQDDNQGYLDCAEKTVHIAEKNIISSDAQLIFIYLQHVDHIGHTTFWGSAEYISALTQTDQWLQHLINALNDSDDYHIMIITDHGGAGSHHANGDLDENVRNIPFIAYGTRFQKGYHIGPSRTLQIAPTIAHFFDLPPFATWSESYLNEIFMTRLN